MHVDVFIFAERKGCFPWISRYCSGIGLGTTLSWFPLLVMLLPLHFLGVFRSSILNWDPSFFWGGTQYAILFPPSLLKTYVLCLFRNHRVCVSVTRTQDVRQPFRNTTPCRHHVRIPLITENEANNITIRAGKTY